MILKIEQNLVLKCPTQFQKWCVFCGNNTRGMAALCAKHKIKLPTKIYIKNDNLVFK